MWFCSLRYPACNSHAPCYTVVCCLHRSKVRFHVISQMARISKNSYWTQNVLSFPLQFLCKIFCILRITERGVIKNMLWSLCTVPVLMWCVYSTGIVVVCTVPVLLWCVYSTSIVVVCTVPVLWCVQYRYCCGPCVQYRYCCGPCVQSVVLSNFKLPPRCKPAVRTSVMLRRANW